MRERPSKADRALFTVPNGKRGATEQVVSRNAGPIASLHFEYAEPAYRMKPNASLCDIDSPELAASVQSRFAIPAHRVPDDSITSSPTWEVIEGNRVGISFPPYARFVQWCILTHPIDRRGFVYVTPDKVEFLRGLDGRIDGAVQLLTSLDLAQQNLAEAIRSKPAMVEFLKGVSIREVPVAADELKHRWIGAIVLRTRIFGSPSWGKVIPDCPACAV